jgi:hypothetical protein
MTDIRWCAACAAETLFELPPCVDGHGDDCPDLACVECGHAVIVGVLLMAGPAGQGVTEAARAA